MASRGKKSKTKHRHSECPTSDGGECSVSRYGYFVTHDVQLLQIQNQNKELRSFSPRANYTD
jgi:hypothetical protein